MRRRQAVADAVAVLVGITLVVLLIPGHAVTTGFVVVMMATCAAWLFSLAACKVYVARFVDRRGEETKRVAAAGAISVVAMVMIGYAFDLEPFGRAWALELFAIVTAVLLLERAVARRVFARLRASGRMSRRVVIIGTDQHAIELYTNVEQDRSTGYEVIGLVGDHPVDDRCGVAVLGRFEDAADVLRRHECVGAMISLSSVNTVRVNRLTRDLTDQGFHVALATGLRDIDIDRMRPQVLGGRSLVYVEPRIRTGWRQRAKRVFDLVLASIGLVLAAPIVAISAVLIKLESPGPVFFRQHRVGRDGRLFEMIKLRTMVQDAEEQLVDLEALNEADGPLFKMENDPRTTRVGRWFRKLSIDELPQFWNVLIGEMSMVGPRPALPQEVEEWDPELHERLRVMPGITGIWQVSGRSDSSYEEYKRLDLYYVDNWSLMHDLRTVLKTVGAVLAQRGAS